MQSRYVRTMYGFVGEKDFGVPLFERSNHEPPQSNGIEVQSCLAVLDSGLLRKPRRGPNACAGRSFQRTPILRVGGIGMDFKRIDEGRSISDCYPYSS